jgi:acetolactate synthase-1/2/3 large subunit
MPAVQAIAQVVRSGGALRLLLGGRALRQPACWRRRAWRRTAASSCWPRSFPTRLERGAGLPVVERIAYLAELATCS